MPGATPSAPIRSVGKKHVITRITRLDDTKIDTYIDSDTYIDTYIDTDIDTYIYSQSG